MANTSFTAAVQESLLCILCYDDSVRGAKAIRSLVPAEAYDPFFRDIAAAAHEYIDRYKKPPGEHTLDLIAALEGKRPDSAEFYRRIFRSMESTREGINRDYVLDRATLFVREQRLKAGASQVIELLERGTGNYVGEAEAVWNKALKSTNDLFSPGTLLNDPNQALRFVDKKHEVFETGIDTLDRYELGPIRKGIHLFMALTGRGKTWWCSHIGKQSLLRRRKVVHISLEMSEDELAMRYLQGLFSITKREQRVNYQRFEVNEHGHLLSMSDYEMPTRPHLGQDNIRTVLRRKMRILDHRPRLYIKEFSSGSLTVRDVEAYLDNMEGAVGFIPDLVILDYPDLMQIDSKAYRHDLGRIYKELAGLARERNFAMVCPTQSSKEGLKKAGVGEGTVSEDYSKIHTSYTVLTYNQTDEEHNLGLARIKAVKCRGDEKGVEVLLSQAYRAGQFHMQSVRMGGNRSLYWNQIRSGDEEGEAE